MIRIKVSQDVLQALNDGFVFHEAQQGGLGDHFPTCLRADIEGLTLKQTSKGWEIESRAP